MPEQQTVPQEMLRALERADGHLNEAQDVLWNTASDLPADTTKQSLEELTQNIWVVQQQLNDLQRQFDK